MQPTPAAYIGMGDTAENVARKWNISRAEQEAFAVRSHQKAAAAAAAGQVWPTRSSPIEQGRSVIRTAASAPRPTAEGLADPEARLRQERLGHRRHRLAADRWRRRRAGLHARTTPKSNGLKPLATDQIHRRGWLRPEIMGIGPVGATKKALARAGIEIGRSDVVELNEAFATPGHRLHPRTGFRDETINIDGGAIALGHPLGATGARITGKAASL